MDDYNRGLPSRSSREDLVVVYAPTVVLHGEHRVGEHVAREWLQDRNTCPLCNVIMFEEEIGHDDNINLRRIWNLQMVQNSYAESGNLEMRQKTHDLWRKLARTRAEAFMEGHIPISPQDFGVYNQHSNFSMYNACQNTRRLDASILIPKLNRVWDTTFGWASAAATMKRSTTVRGIDEEHPTLKTPCHPLAIALLDDMVEYIEQKDGMVGVVWELRRNLHRVFDRSDLCRMWRELVNRNQAPQGFFIYQRHMVEVVLSAFLELPECAPRLRPRQGN